MKRRRMRKQVGGVLSPWTERPQHGDRRIIAGKVVDLVMSVWNGEETPRPRLAPAQRAGALPVQIEGVWYWQYPDPQPDTQKQASFLEE